MPSGRAGITGTPSFTSAGTCTKSWKATGFAMRGSSRTAPPVICRGVAVTATRWAGEKPACRGLAHLLVMLREEGAFPPVTADEPPCRQLIEGYCRFLRHDRGLAETTVASYRRYLRDFLVSRGAAVSPVELAALGAAELDGSAGSHGRTWPARRARSPGRPVTRPHKRPCPGGQPHRGRHPGPPARPHSLAHYPAAARPSCG